MRFKGLDLNLLVLFDALMETRSVTRTAERLSLTQPAVSAALQRLRIFFNDPMFVSVGKRMQPTPFAEQMLPDVQRGLDAINLAISTPTIFDPASSERGFKIVASDYIMITVLVPLARKLAKIAPHIQLEMIQPLDDVQSDFVKGMVDLLIVPEEFLVPWHVSELLFDDEQVVIGWACNPLFQTALTEKMFYSAGHVAVTFGANREAAFADAHLKHLGQARKVELTVSGFTTVPWYLVDSNRLAVVHQRLARAFAAQFEIASAPVPFEIPRMRTMIQYHSARDADAGLLWLRREIMKMAQNT